MSAPLSSEGIIAELGANGIQNKPFLETGQTYFFYRDPEIKISSVRTNEGIAIESN
jgi:hypothetical protein